MAFNPPDGNQTIMVDKDSVLQNPQNIFTTSPVVSQKGWHYNFIDKSGLGSESTWNSKNSVLILYLSDVFVLSPASSGVENTDFVSGFAVGDVVSFVDDNHLVDAFTITAISGNKITIKGGETGNAYAKINEADGGWVSLKRGQVLNNDYSLYCTAKPTVGNAIMLSGTIANGTNIVLGSEALVWGRGNTVKSDKSFTAGDGLLNETYNGFIAGRFNAPNTDNDPFIIGCGTSNTDRQNALAVGGFGTTDSYLKTTKENFRFNKPIKIDGTTASSVVATDSNNKLSTTSTTTTELGYLSGVKSNIQVQINNLSTSAGNKAEKDASNLSADNITSWKEKLDIDALEAEIDAKATKATTLNGYGITDAYTKTQVDAKVNAKADKATTLSGYNIGDAFTKDEVNAALALKQDKTDNTLNTTDKTIVGAINEINDALGGDTGGLGLVQMMKQNGGQLCLNGGSATTNCKPTFGAAQSLLFTYEVSESELDASPWSIIGNAHIWSGQKGFGFAKNTSNKIQCGFNWAGDTTGRAFIETNTVFADGKPHAWALVCGKNETNGFLKLYRDGVLVGSKTDLALFDDFIPTYGFYLGKAQAGGSTDSSAKGRLSRVAFFNFDVSASDAAYTLADYQSGKSIPPSFNLTTPQGLLDLKESTIASLQWYAKRAGAVQYAGVWEDGAFVLKNTADTTVDAEMKQGFYIRPYITLSETIPVGALVEVSFDEWVFNTTYFVQSPETPVADVSKQRFYGWLTVGTSPEMANSGHGKVRSDKKFRFYISASSDKLYFSNYGFALLNSISAGDVIPANTAFWKIKGLKVKVNGAALNLENYTIARNTTTRLIKDLSAGGYDATVSGNIRGDMDRRVEVFVDEIKTQIAQSTTTTD